MYSLKAKGKLKGVDLGEWAAETNFKKLPERVKKASLLDIVTPGFIKMAILRRELISLPRRTDIQIMQKEREMAKSQQPPPTMKRTMEVSEKR